MKNNMKGAMDLGGLLLSAGFLAIAFVIYVVVQSLGGSLLTSFQASQDVNGTAYNITGSGLTGLLNMANQNSNIGLVAAFVIIIGMLMAGIGVFLYRQKE